MKSKTGISIIITIILAVTMSISVFGAQATNTAYTDVGGGGFYNDYFQWIGDWNQNTDDESYMATISANIQFTPLVSDLNSDGYNEVLTVNSAGGFKIWNRTEQNTLSLIGGWSETATVKAPPIIFDIDQDGNKEIIYSTTANIEIYRFENNIVTNPKEFDISQNFSDYSDGDAVLGCRESNECLWVGAENDGREFDGDNSLRAISFSYSQIEEVLTLDSTSSSNVFYCLSYIKSMPMVDIELDSSKRFLVSAIETDITGNDYVQLYSIWMNSTDVSHIELSHKNADVTHRGFSNLQTCPLGEYGKYFTSPVTVEFDAGSVGNEVFIGYSPSTDDWVINYYSSALQSIAGVSECDGDDVLESPTSGERSGNVYVCKMYPDTNGFDVCMNVYDNANDEMSVIVFGSTDNDGYITDRCEDTEYDTDYDISYDNAYTLLGHGGIYRDIVLENAVSSAYYEIITPYGVMKTDWDATAFGLLSDDMDGLDMLYRSPLQNTTLIADAVTGSEDDLIGYNSEKLFIIDDNNVDQNAYVSAWDWNPCIEDTIKVNTSAEVTMTIRDGDAEVSSGGTVENVQGRVIWYYPNEDYEAYGETTLIYDSIDNESESDGVAEATQYAFGTHATNGNMTPYALIKSQPTGTLNRFRMYVSSVSGAPGDEGFVYDFYACQTGASSLSTNPRSQCSSEPGLVKANYQLSNQWGNTAGYKTVDLDHPFSLSMSFSYIVWAEYVSGGTPGTNDYYNMRADDNGITNNYFTMEFDSATGNLTYSRLMDFQMWYIPQSMQIYDSGWSAELISGGTFTHSITVDQKVSNGVVRLMARDTAHLETPTYVDFPFNVQDYGVEYGQTTCGGSQTIEGGLGEAGEGALTGNVDDVNDNAIKGAMDTAKDELGFRGWSYTSMWFFLMFLVAVGIWFTPINDAVEHQGVLKLGAMIIIESALLFLGLKFSFIGIGTILILGVISLGVVVISFRRSAVGG